MEPTMRLLDLLDRIKSDPNNAGYWFLLRRFTREEILAALDELGY